MGLGTAGRSGGLVTINACVGESIATLGDIHEHSWVGSERAFPALDAWLLIALARDVLPCFLDGVLIMN
jgi:hypothetical protein